MIRLARPDVGEEELAEIAAVLESGQLTMGPKVDELEGLLAGACGVEHAVAVSSGTAALHLAILALGLEPGDEVLVPAYTFPATANVVALSGLRPVLVDVDPVTMNLDLEQVAAALGPRTRAVLAVHLFGRPLDWEALQAAVPDDVVLVEDAAGALGARRRGRPCGSLGRMGCLSFHPRKIVTTGEGGAVTTDDEGLADAIRSMRHHGWSAGDMPAPGVNYRLADVLCALGIPQVRRLDELLAARTALAAAYTERLRGIVATPAADEGDVHGWQAYVVRDRPAGRGARGATGPRDRGADRHVRRAPARCVRRAGLLPRRRRGVRACAGPALPRAAERGRRRPRVRGLDKPCK